MRATDNISGSPRPHRGTCGPRDTIIWHHLEVHPARPSDKGPPSFSGTWEFNHATRQIDVKRYIARFGHSNFLDSRIASHRTGETSKKKNQGHGYLYKVHLYKVPKTFCYFAGKIPTEVKFIHHLPRKYGLERHDRNLIANATRCRESYTRNGKENGWTVITIDEFSAWETKTGDEPRSETERTRWRTRGMRNENFALPPTICMFISKRRAIFFLRIFCKIRCRAPSRE